MCITRGACTVHVEVSCQKYCVTLNSRLHSIASIQKRYLETDYAAIAAETRTIRMCMYVRRTYYSFRLPSDINSLRIKQSLTLEQLLKLTITLCINYQHSAVLFEWYRAGICV